MSGADRKDLETIEHLETIDGTHHGVVTDTIAAEYVNPGIHIPPEENKRLRRKIYRKYVDCRVSPPFLH